MAQVVVNEASLSDIAQALRSKLGTNETFKPSQMGDGVRRLPSASSAPVLITKQISANGTYAASGDDADGYSSVEVSVANSYTSSDEGKVVDNGALVSQTSLSITSNNTYDTTKNNEVVVNVANSYSASDEGKVVDSGALVSQTSRNITANGTYDTTTNNEVVVNVSGGGGNIPIIQEADWKAMTTAQKQSCGLVVIQTATTGFNRGDYVNGADYTPIPVHEYKTYIQSSGAQYIKTGYYPKANTKFEAVLNILNQNVSWANAYCAGGNSGHEYSYFLTGNYFYYAFDSGQINGGAHIPVNTKYQITHTRTSLTTLTEDDVENTTTFNGGNNTSTNPLILFSMGSGNGDYGSATRATMKLYLFRIYEDDTLIMELVPAKDSNDVVCLYDNVSHNYFYNELTTPFTYGEDI